jgi:uncharacterized protein YjgD (DUF1641 family)
MDKDLAVLHTKIDQLTEQVAFLTDQAQDQQRRGRELDELKSDLIPIGNQLVNLTIQELEEIGADFELEDLLYLLKRVLRNTHLILSMMDRLESIMGIADEVELLGKQVFSATVESLDRLERSGLFQQTSDLLRNLSEGDTLAEINRVLVVFQENSGSTQTPPSLLGLLGQLNQPEARRGLDRLVKMVTALGGDPGEEIKAEV